MRFAQESSRSWCAKDAAKLSMNQLIRLASITCLVSHHVFNRRGFNVKSTTNIWIALRNIGDSQDRGEAFNGTVTESILWMAQKLAKISMAGRIVMGIGRTESDALKGIDVKNAGKTAISDDMKGMLDSVFEGAIEDEQPVESIARVAGDDYVA